MDTELVRRAQDGDREAFAALVPPAVERLLPVAFQILGDTDLAEEATHIAVINAWRKLPCAPRAREVRGVALPARRQRVP